MKLSELSVGSIFRFLTVPTTGATKLATAQLELLRRACVVIEQDLSFGLTRISPAKGGPSVLYMNNVEIEPLILVDTLAKE